MVREREMKNTDKDVSMCPELALTVLLGLTFIHNYTLMFTGLGSVKCIFVFGLYSSLLCSAMLHLFDKKI